MFGKFSQFFNIKLEHRACFFWVFTSFRMCVNGSPDRYFQLSSKTLFGLVFSVLCYTTIARSSINHKPLIPIDLHRQWNRAVLQTIFTFFQISSKIQVFKFLSSSHRATRVSLPCIPINENRFSINGKSILASHLVANISSEANAMKRVLFVFPQLKKKPRDQNFPVFRVEASKTFI